jgi:hypothetical protein
VAPGAAIVRRDEIFRSPAAERATAPLAATVNARSAEHGR